ncbi:MAG TPA: MFS transporter [Candidatus Limnocylindria bacterium]
MKLPLLLEPLRHRDFRLLWTGQTVSVFGDFMHGVALPFQLLALGATPVQLGLGVSISIAVQLVLILFGGAIVDRLPRRRIILASDLLSGIAVTLVGTLSIAGLLRIEYVYLEAAFFGATAAFFMPAMGAIIPELVPSDVLVQGNTLRGFSRQAARLGGPVLGGILVAGPGPGWALIADGVTFFVSFVALSAARPAGGAPKPRRPLLHEIREGIAFTFSVGWLWITIALFALVNASFTGPMSVGLPLLVRDVLRADARAFGLITAAGGVGEIVGGLFVGQVRLRRIGIAMYLFAAAGGLGVMTFGLFPRLPIVLLASVGIGVSFVGFGVLWESAVQRNVPRELLGRVGSVDWFGSLLLGPVSPLVVGAIVQSVGPAAVFTVAGALAAALCLGALLVPSIRDLRG